MLDLSGDAAGDAAQALQVLYKDEWFAVVNKPAGWLVFRSPGDDPDEVYLLDRVALEFGLPRVWSVHRLDRSTSGVVVVAMSANACSALTANWHAVASDHSEEATVALDEAKRSEWAALQAEAPPPWPRGKPPKEHIERLRAHSSRVKVFLALLSANDRFELTGRRRHAQESDSAGDGGSRCVRKLYVACVHGVLSDAEVIVDRPLGRRPDKTEVKARRRARAEAEAEAAKMSKRSAVEEALEGAATEEGATEEGATEAAATEEAAREASQTEAAIEASALARARSAVSASTSTLQSSCTIVRREAALWKEAGSPQASLLVCELHSGRRHQIRRHLAGIGHPVYGDARHGPSRVNAYLAREIGLQRLFLHAFQLSFAHPFRSGEIVEVSCPMPEELAACLRRMPETDLGGISPHILAPPRLGPAATSSHVVGPPR